MVMIENDDRTPLPRALFDRPALQVAPGPIARPPGGTVAPDVHVTCGSRGSA